MTLLLTHATLIRTLVLDGACLEKIFQFQPNLNNLSEMQATMHLLEASFTNSTAALKSKAYWYLADLVIKAIYKNSLTSTSLLQMTLARLDSPNQSFHAALCRLLHQQNIDVIELMKKP